MALKKCKECGKDISKKATKCPGCGSPQPKNYSLLSLVVLGGFSWFVYSLVTTSINEETVNAVSQPKIKQESVPPLELLSFSCSKEHGYTTVAGEVKNTSAAKLTNIMAVGEFRTKDGSLVKSEDAILQYNPIMPGQTSPFTVMGTDNPLITNCGLKFKEMFGGQIDYIDKAKK